MANMLSGIIFLSIGVVVLANVFIKTVKDTNTSGWTSGPHHGNMMMNFPEKNWNPETGIRPEGYTECIQGQRIEAEKIQRFHEAGTSFGMKRYAEHTRTTNRVMPRIKNHGDNKLGPQVRLHCGASSRSRVSRSSCWASSTSSAWSKPQRRT